jgi:hypothetical protein
MVLELLHPPPRFRRMGERKRELNEQLDRLEQELPKPAAEPVHKLRRPDWKWVRLPAGVLLLMVGLVSSTPGLNSRFAAGLALLAIDVPFLRKPTARALRWGLDKWHAWRRPSGSRANENATARHP